MPPRHIAMVVMLLALISSAACGTSPTPTLPPGETPPPSTAAPALLTITPEPTAAATVSPPFSGSGAGLIAFTSYRDGTNNAEVYIMNADGSVQRRLTNHKGIDMASGWSPDGKRLVFMSDRDGDFEIYTINADGADERRLTDSPGDDMWPAWSPDGAKIAFQSERDGNFEIYVMSADGNDPQRLTNNAANDYNPDWSPDGAKIAFDSERSGNGDIYVMPAPGAQAQVETDGSNLLQLTTSSETDMDPAWSPDGKRIAFMRGPFGRPEIYLMDADGGNVAKLPIGDDNGFSPTWSPDGKWIAFYSYRPGPYSDGKPNAIYLVDSAGNNLRQLTELATLSFHPIWQPPKGLMAQDSAKEIVTGMVAAKLAAMKAKDLEQYMALIDESDKEYATEQRNWFLIYQDAVTSDFTIEVKRAEQVNDSTIIASIYQHYLYGSEKADRAVNYEARFVKTPNGWKDADLNFAIKETPHFIVKYPKEVEAKAIEVSEEAERAYASVVKELGLEPRDKTSIKLYASQEMLRQSTDIRIAYLFNGWAEDGESIKMYAYRDKDALARVIAHELTHKITLGISDSLCSWFAEGLAVYFGNQPFQGGNALQLERFTVEELAKPVTWLEKENLIQLTDEKTIGLYYAVSGMVVEFMVETYGVDKLKALLNELSKSPRYNRGYDYADMEQETQARLHKAIETVLGVTMDEFDQQWLEWLNSQQ